MTNQITNEPYVQAPPFFRAIVQATSRALAEEIDDSDFEHSMVHEYDEDRIVPFEDLCDPEWYENVFLTQTKFTDSDAAVILAALTHDCVLAPYEVDRFEYEIIVNGGQALVDRLSRSTPSQLELKRVASGGVKFDQQQMRSLVKLLPQNGQLDLTTGVPKGIPKQALHRVLRWIQAFPPLHREIVNGRTVICAIETCPNLPERIPGHGFVFRNRPTGAKNAFDYSTRVAMFLSRTRIEEDRPKEQDSDPFSVLVNGTVVQHGQEAKLDVNFSSKSITIDSGNANLEIVRQVKTLDRPYGAIEIRTKDGAPKILETQVSRAWWFSAQQMLVFVTQSDQIYSWLRGNLEHLGEIPFSNYGIACAVNLDLSELVISSSGQEFLRIHLGGQAITQRVKLGEIPRAFWDEILAIQCQTERNNSTGLEPASAPSPASVTPLSHVRWFEYKQEMTLFKAGITTVGQLLARSPESVKELGKLRIHDLDDIESKIEALLNREFRADTTGELREQIWLDLESRGWVKALDPLAEYELPRFCDPSLLEKAKVENQIVGASFLEDKLMLTLRSGLKVVLNSELEADVIYVQPWLPNSFLQRRFNLWDSEDY